MRPLQAAARRSVSSDNRHAGHRAWTAPPETLSQGQGGTPSRDVGKTSVENHTLSGRHREACGKARANGTHMWHRVRTRTRTVCLPLAHAFAPLCTHSLFGCTPHTCSYSDLLKFVSLQAWPRARVSLATSKRSSGRSCRLAPNPTGTNSANITRMAHSTRIGTLTQHSSSSFRCGRATGGSSRNSTIKGCRGG